MKKKAFLLFLITICVLSGHSQELSNYNLRFYHGNLDKNYRIEYDQSGDSTKIIFSKKVSNQKMSKKDSLEVHRIIKAKNLDSQDKKRLAQIMDNQIEYNSDTLFVNSKNPIDSKIDNLVKHWNQLKQDIERNPLTNIGIDGHTIRIDLQNEFIGYDWINIHSSNTKYYPEIAELLSSMEDYYKKESKNPVID